MVNIDVIKRDIVVRTMEARAKYNLGPVVHNASLAIAAQRHAESMARGPGLSRFDHNVDGKDPGSRATDAGYLWSMISENIAWSAGYSRGNLAKQFVDGWLDSPGHRRNILEPAIFDIGVGVARGAGDQWFAVQNFGVTNGVSTKNCKLPPIAYYSRSPQGRAFGINAKTLRMLSHSRLFQFVRRNFV